MSTHKPTKSNPSAPIEPGLLQIGLSIKQFCRRYNISRSRYYAERKLKRIHAKKSGTRVIILLSEAERWSRELPDAE